MRKIRKINNNEEKMVNPSLNKRKGEGNSWGEGFRGRD